MKKGNKLPLLLIFTLLSLLFPNTGIAASFTSFLPKEESTLVTYEIANQKEKIYQLVKSSDSSSWENTGYTQPKKPASAWYRYKESSQGLVLQQYDIDYGRSMGRANPGESYLIKYPVTLGQKWTNTLNTGGSYNEEWTTQNEIVSTNASVETKAGTFNNVVVVKEVESEEVKWLQVSDDVVKKGTRKEEYSTFYHYYVPGIGLIKQEEVKGSTGEAVTVKLLKKKSTVPPLTGEFSVDETISRGGLSKVVVYNNVAYFTSLPSYYGNQTLYAVDIKTEKKLWKLNASNGATFSSDPTVLNGILYFENHTNAKDELYAVNPKTGKIIWKYSNASIRNLIFKDYYVYLSAGNNFYALNAKTGNVLWKNSIPASSSVLIYGDTLFYEKASSNWINNGYKTDLFALNRKTGKLAWKYSNNGTITPKEVLDGKLIIEVANPGIDYLLGTEGVYALNVKTGKKIWQKSKEYSQPFLYKSKLYSINNKSVVELSSPNGSAKKKLDTIISLDSQNHIRINQFLYVWSSNTIRAFNIETGKLLWKQNLGADAFSANVLDKKLYVVMYNQLITLDRNTGKTLSVKKLNSTISGEPILYNGKVYFTTDNGTLYITKY